MPSTGKRYVRIPIHAEVYKMLSVYKFAGGYSSNSEIIRDALRAYYYLYRLCNGDYSCIKSRLEEVARDVR